jgi:putative ABC transport system substrate-binding protein
MSEGLTVTIEDRSADGHYDRLPALAEDLVSRQVTVIAADFLPAALAAKAATPTIPIVFLSGSDPIGSGLVSSINRPTGNVTGIAFMFTRLGAKNMELLRELVPNATVIAALANPINPNAEPQLKDLRAASRTLGVELVTDGASNEAEIDSIFPTLSQRQIEALINGRRLSHQSARSTRDAGEPLCGTDNLSVAPVCGGRRTDELRRKSSRRISPMRRLCWKDRQGRQAR